MSTYIARMIGVDTVLRCPIVFAFSEVVEIDVK